MENICEQFVQKMISDSVLLPIGSEERGVLGDGSSSVAILPACQNMKNIALLLHEHEFSWVIEKRYTSGAVFRP